MSNAWQEQCLHCNIVSQGFPLKSTENVHLTMHKAARYLFICYEFTDSMTGTLIRDRNQSTGIIQKCLNSVLRYSEFKVMHLLDDMPKDGLPARVCQSLGNVVSLNSLYDHSI